MTAGTHWHNFGATNAEGTCLWCGRKLRRQRFAAAPGLGDYGDGFFCGLRCSYQYAKTLARGGRRLVPAKENA